MCDGSTDSAVAEQEMIYVLFNCEVTPVLKCLSMKNVENADVPGLKLTLRSHPITLVLLAITTN